MVAVVVLVEEGGLAVANLIVKMVVNAVALPAGVCRPSKLQKRIFFKFFFFSIFVINIIVLFSYYCFSSRKSHSVNHIDINLLLTELEERKAEIKKLTERVENLEVDTVGLIITPYTTYDAWC